MTSSDGSAHIVIATLGSLGDIHPYLAIALGLRERGHRVTIATSEFYRSKIESEGVGFHPVRPNLTPDAEMIRQVMDARKGGEYIIKHLLMPAVRASYDDLTEAVRGAGMLITHPITYAGPVVAAKTGIRWVSSALAPISFLSNDDPPALAPLPSFLKIPAINRIIARLSKRVIRSWSDPVRTLRAEIGLPPGADPVFEGQHSPDLVLALFSSALAAPQPDWPPNTHITGFSFYDQLEKGMTLSPELDRFLAAGTPPIVFTLGSAAVMDARDFYVQSAKAAEMIGRRAVLLTGSGVANKLPDQLPAGVMAADYAPYSEIFPRAAVIVHQGGVGTTGQAMRAGRPMLVLPFAHDQHDNAARVSRLGVAREIGRHRYRADRVAGSLRKLLEDPGYRVRAEEVASKVRAEDGAAAACDLIEARLRLARATTPGSPARRV